MIAAPLGLSQRDMDKAMDRLEGRLIEPTYKECQASREIRLLPDWENPEALAGDVVFLWRKTYAETMIECSGVSFGSGGASKCIRCNENSLEEPD